MGKPIVSDRLGRFEMILTTDFWESVINDERVNPLPDWSNVQSSIDRLDEKVHTLVALDDENGSSLLIGGGQTRLIVALSRDQNHLLAREGNETVTVSVIVGGQYGDYRKRNLITPKKAKSIAKAYFLGNDIFSIFQWDID